MEPRVILAPNPSPMTLDGTRTYLVGREAPAVIDPGPALAEHVRAILDALAGRQPIAILVTHAHADHAGAAPELAARTDAPVLRLVDPRAVPPGPIETDAGSLRLVPTPGHTPDHLAIHWTRPGSGGGALFVGDLLLGVGDTTLVAAPEGDLAEYLRSLDRIEELRPSVLHPAHGPPIVDPGAAIRRYRRHREERLAQLAAALERFPTATAGELVGQVYGLGLDPALRDAAEGSIRAMSTYLAQRG